MKSVADDLARETLEKASRMTAAERFELALALGRQAVETLAAARGITTEQAERTLRRNNQIGRRPSRCARMDDE